MLGRGFPDGSTIIDSASTLNGREYGGITIITDESTLNGAVQGGGRQTSDAFHFLFRGDGGITSSLSLESL